jgi:putative nucleotidyltransferase with HDIG domain
MTKVAKLILDHHEWMNGQGYPRAKSGNDIPWGAQVVRLADSVDISLQTGRFSKLKELKNKLSLRIDKEYSKELFAGAFKKIERSRIFDKLTAPRNVTLIFNQINNQVGLLYIPHRIDAIGTTLEVVSQIIDMRHPYTSGHSLRVSRYAMACALAMNLKHDEITHIKWAGLIHDIGKIIVSRAVLEKPTGLTKRDLCEVKKHALFTQKILEMISTLQDISPIAINHHEYFDGSGYPKGLKKDEIPLGARIMAICDAFDAMTSNRPYRKPFTAQQACKEIEKQAGQQFDPEIVKKTLPIFRNLGL